MKYACMFLGHARTVSPVLFVLFAALGLSLGACLAPTPRTSIGESSSAGVQPSAVAEPASRATTPSAATSSGASAIAALLKNVNEVRLTGAPSELIVFGKDCHPIFLDPTGTPNGALYTDGSQHIIWLGHSDFFSATVLPLADNSRFLENAFSLMKGDGKILARLNNSVGLLDWAKPRGYEIHAPKLLPENLDEYSLLIIDFRSFGAGVLHKSELARIQGFLQRGGSCIALGLGWVYNTYGDGRYGQSLSRYAGNLALALYGAAWGSRYAAVRALPNTDKRKGSLNANFEEALLRFTGRKQASAEENKALLQAAFATDYHRELALFALNPTERRSLLTLLKRSVTLRVPSFDNPVTLQESEAVWAIIFAQLFLSSETAWQEFPTEMRQILDYLQDGLATFPAFGLSANRRTQQGSVRVNVPVTYRGLYSSGLFVPAGAQISLRWSDWSPEAGICPFTVQVGINDDDLASSRRDIWQRWPSIVQNISLQSGQAEFISPSGGMLYIICNELATKAAGDNGELRIEVTGAVPYARYVHGRTSPQQWQQELANAQAPWAELILDTLIITTKTEYLASADLQAVGTFWNKAMSSYTALSGFSFNGTAQANRSHERITFDVQTALGYMHSGYPIVAHMDRAETVIQGALAAADSQTAYNMWGFMHELGHNWQRGSYTATYAGEVSVNIFTLFTLEQVYGTRAVDQRMPQITAAHRLNDYYTKPDPALFVKEPFIGLYQYIYLIDAFGYEPMSEVLQGFETLLVAPKTDREKEDLWARLYSQACRRDLSRWFEKWGMYVSPETKALVKSWPVWLP